MNTDNIRTNDCSCQKDTNLYTPVKIQNPPSLSTIRYRVGTHSKFKASMIANLSKYSALKKLTSRSDDDLAIGMLDAWATVSDVLTFYQERIANEGFLRTASERRSLLELARSIGYELGSGVAASTLLAFTLEDVPGAVEKTNIDSGIAVQSLPGQGEMPQIFETIESIIARPEWNNLKPNTIRMQSIDENTSRFYFKGTDNLLKPGDGLLIIECKKNTRRPVAFKKVSNVEIDATLQQTIVDVVSKPGTIDYYSIIESVKEYGTTQNVITPKDLKINDEFTRSDLIKYIQKFNLQIDEFIKIANSLRKEILEDVNKEVYVFRVQSGLFGHNAPRFDTLPEDLQDVYKYGECKNWDNPPAKINEDSRTRPYDNGSAIYLDGLYQRILPKSWIVLQSRTRAEEYLKPEEVPPTQAQNVLKFLNSAKKPEEIAEAVEFPCERDVGIKVAENILEERDKLEGFSDLRQVHNVRHVGPERFTEIVKALGQKRDATIKKHSACWRTCAFWITGVRERTMADFLLSAKVTGLSLNANPSDLSKFLLRETSAYAESEKLELAELHDTESVKLNNVTLNCLIDGLEKGQLILVSGNLENKPGISKSEVATISEIKYVFNPIPCTRIYFTENLANTYKRETVTLNANVARASHGKTVREVLGGGNPSQSRQEFTLKQKPLTFSSSPTASGAQSTLEISIDDIKWKECPNLYELEPDEKGYITRIEDDNRIRVIFGDGIRGARPQAGLDNIKAKYRVGIGKSGMLNAGQINLLMSRPLGVRSVTNPIEPTGAADPEDREQARQNVPHSVLTMERLVSLKDFENIALTFQGISKAKAIQAWDGEKRFVQLTAATIDGKYIEDAPELFRNLVKQINSSKDPLILVSFKSFNHRKFKIEGKILITKEMDHDAVKLAVNKALINNFSFEKRQFGQAVTLSEIIALIQQVKGVIMVDIDYLYDSSNNERKSRNDLIPEEITDIFTIDPEGVILEAMTQ